MTAPQSQVIGKLGNSRLRQSPDSAWPLRDEHGRTWAERKKLEQGEEPMTEGQLSLWFILVAVCCLLSFLVGTLYAKEKSEK